MLRSVIIVLVALLSTACASLLDDASQFARSSLQQMVNSAFSQKLTAGIDWVIDDLAVKGGFLDDPLVRILMPPPLGLIVDTSRDIHANPNAAMLQVLMNRAAENAIPVAGPILRDKVLSLDDATLTTLVNAPRQAATLYLKEEVGPTVVAAVLPSIATQLQSSGAQAIYADLLASHTEGYQSASEPDTGADKTADVAPEQLGNYVAEKTVSGLFQKLAVKEITLREQLPSVGTAD